MKKSSEKKRILTSEINSTQYVRSYLDTPAKFPLRWLTLFTWHQQFITADEAIQGQ
jgi:hypothetical protein